MIRIVRQCVLMFAVFSQVYVCTNAFSSSNILDTLYHQEQTGQVFILNWRSDSNGLNYHVPLRAYKFEDNEYKELYPNIQLISEGSRRKIRMNKWVACESTDDYNSKKEAEFRQLNDEKTILFDDTPAKLEYKINNHVVGTVTAYILNIENAAGEESDRIKNDVLFGEYKFVNGETHTIGFCVDKAGNLAKLHTVDSLSGNGKAIKSGFDMEKWLFNSDSRYDSTGKYSVDETNRNLYIGKKGYSLHSFDFYFNSAVGHEGLIGANAKFKKVKITPDIDTADFTGEIEFKKCDNTEYSITDRIEKAIRVYPKKVHIDYYFFDYKYMEYDGYINKPNSPEDKGSRNPYDINNIAGTYRLTNGDIINQTQCNDRGSLYDKFTRINKSEYGKQYAIRAKLQEEARIVSENAEKKRSDAAYDARVAKNTAIENASRKKASLYFTNFRNRIKVGTNVMVQQGTFSALGKVLQIDGDIINVQVTRQFVNYDLLNVRPYEQLFDLIRVYPTAGKTPDEFVKYIGTL